MPSSQQHFMSQCGFTYQVGSICLAQVEPAFAFAAVFMAFHSPPSKLWYNQLFAFLTKDGFKHSHVDKCMLYKNAILILACVDDMGIATNNAKEFDMLIERLAC